MDFFAVFVNNSGKLFYEKIISRLINVVKNGV